MICFILFIVVCMRSGKREKFRKNILGLKYIFLFALRNGFLRSEKEKGYKLLFIRDYALSKILCYPLSTVLFLSALGLPSCNKMDSWALNFIGPFAKKNNNLTLLFSKKLCDWIIYSEWPGSCSRTVNQYIRKCMQHGVENMHSGVYGDKEGQGSGDTI